ncbi:hypothetical protein IG631_03116 [Alternaria alternata]|nr:hypothetical protein IG631_03116 [Alternaria alternata]
MAVLPLAYLECSFDAGWTHGLSMRRSLARRVTMTSFTIALAHGMLPLLIRLRNKVGKANGGLLTRSLHCHSWIYLGVRRSIYRLVGFARHVRPKGHPECGGDQQTLPVARVAADCS